MAGVCPDELPPIAAASMWTRKDVKEFKDSLKNDHESVLKVGSGEIVTVSCNKCSPRRIVLKVKVVCLWSETKSEDP